MIPKIAMLFPYAPSYREPIYLLMDKVFDVDWFFCGNAERNLKLFNYDLLKNCNLTMKEEKFFGPISHYIGWDKLGLENYYAIIIAGVPTNISEYHLAFKCTRKKNGPKLFFWTHGWYGKENFFRGVLKKLLFKRGDGMLLYGNYAKELMIKEGFYKDRLHVVHNSLDYNKQLELRNKLELSAIYKEHFKNDYPTIVFIGRLTYVKKLDQLINAVAKLYGQYEFYNIVFVGDGEVRSSLEALVKENELCDNVWFYGACFDDKANAELIYNADLCVAPGNVGLTAIHSLMFGCPVITHDDFKWQMPEFESLRPYMTGNFFKYNDVNSLAEKISEWFRVKGSERNHVRSECYKEIDTQWNPEYQIEVLKHALQID